MKRTDPLSVKQIIDAVLLSEDRKDNALQHRAAWMWGEVVGPGVNRLTTRRYVVDGVLHVYISSASLKQDLGYQRQSIVEHINNAIGAEVITKIQLH